MTLTSPGSRCHDKRSFTAGDPEGQKGERTRQGPKPGKRAAARQPLDHTTSQKRTDRPHSAQEVGTTTPVYNV